MSFHYAKCCFVATLLLSTLSYGNGRSFGQACRCPAFLQREYQHQFGNGGANEHQSPLSCMQQNLSIRGGADDTQNDEDASLVQSATEPDEPVKPKLFSFFRPRTSTPPSAATAVDRSNINADKIPHGPTGGGYVMKLTDTETGTGDGDVLMVSNKDNRKEEVSNLSTYPSAFAINQGHSIQSMKEILSNSDDQDESKEQAKNATSITGKNKAAKEMPTAANAEKNITALSVKNSTKIMSGSTNATSNITELKMQAETAPVINISISQSVAGESKQDYISSGYVSCISTTQ